MFTMLISQYCICRKEAVLALGICLVFLFATNGGAVQPPPPPLNIVQFKTLITQADLIVVGKIKEVKETEGTVEAAVVIEKLLKGKFAGKTIEIKESYNTVNPPKSSIESKNAGESNKIIVAEIAGPNTYHGKYKKDLRIVVLMEKIEGTNKYRPLGSGTYNKHLCEFLIENDGIKTYYFQSAEDVGKYTVSEKLFTNFIKKLIRSNLSKGAEL